jgi:hypothetical protein
MTKVSVFSFQVSAIVALSPDTRNLTPETNKMNDEIWCFKIKEFCIHRDVLFLDEKS